MRLSPVKKGAIRHGHTYDINFSRMKKTRNKEQTETDFKGDHQLQSRKGLVH